jgi:hypothetical protein
MRSGKLSKAKEGRLVMDLKQSFSEWYSIVDPGFTGEKISLRLNAITKIAGSTTTKRVVNLVSLFYGITTDQMFINEIRAALRDADDTYVSHDTAELAVVAAGVLYLIMSKAGNVANAAGLLLLSGEYGGMRGTARIDAVVLRARNYLFEEGSRVREEALQFPNMTELLKAPTAKVQAATKNGAPAAGEGSNSDVGLEIHGDLLKALKAYAAGMAQALNILEKRRQEESSVLYWLLGERTLTSEEPFEKVDKARLALLAADDLAIQTCHLPGPASCRSILNTVLGRGKGNSQQSSTENCIGKLTAEDGAKLLKRAKAYSPIFMPISFALEKNQENGWGGGWENAFTAQTKMAVGASRALEEIAEQYFRELLLSRLLSEAN